MSRAAWIVVAVAAVICGAFALSPASIANAEGEDDWLSPATSTTTAAPTTTSTSTTAPSTTTTEAEWLSPATSASTPTTTDATTTTTAASTTSTTRQGGGASGSDPGNAPPSTSTTTACQFLNPSTGKPEPGLPEDCDGLPASSPDPTVTTITTPTTNGAPRTNGAPKTPSPSTIPALVDPATTTVPAGPAPSGSIPPANGPTAPNEQAAESPTTTSGTIQQADLDLDARPLQPQRASVKSIGVEAGHESAPGAVTAERGYDGELLAAGAEVRLDTSPSFVFTFPWDRSNPIGVELGPGRVLGAWVIWMTITLLVMAFWVPSPTRRTRRATARAAVHPVRRG